MFNGHWITVFRLWTFPLTFRWGRCFSGGLCVVSHQGWDNLGRLMMRNNVTCTQTHGHHIYWWWYSFFFFSQLYFMSFSDTRQADTKHVWWENYHHDTRSSSFCPPGGFPRTLTVSFGGSCRALPANCHPGHLVDRCLTYGHFSSSRWKGWSECFSLPPLRNLTDFPDGVGSQTGNLAVTNPPHKPSGHSCPPCWLVISSREKSGCFKT